jgi:polyribonucleotide nucleotidyltransferase
MFGHEQMQAAIRAIKELVVGSRRSTLGLAAAPEDAALESAVRTAEAALTEAYQIPRR